MTVVVWDKPGERFYQTGVDRGVLYLDDGTAVPWNGLTGIEESSNSELKSYYLDGVKYLNTLLLDEFVGKLKAFTYPEEFDLVNGIARPSPGFSFYNQTSKSFGLTYRTMVGNDLEGMEFGYKVHILYNVIAEPEAASFETLQDSVQPVEFAWTLSGTPPRNTAGVRPTVHISIDSAKTPPDILKAIENILYGTDTSNPSLPSINEITEIFGYLGALIIIDHGDGTWSAIDESDLYITMIDSTNFRIDNVDATYSDPDTYDVSSTNVGGS